MELTDLERAEFTALANWTFDLGLWSEDELQILRKAKLGYEEEQALERDGIPPLEQPTTPEDGFISCRRAIQCAQQHPWLVILL